MSKKRVAVLMGGFSGEREVSLSSAQGVIRALDELGHEAIPIDVTRDISKLVKELTPKPDVAVNILHGRWGEDGCIQGLLELMDIPYTNSGVLGSSLSMHKSTARRICQDEGIRVPEGKVVPISAFRNGEHPMEAPYVIKPIGEGSSLGVTIIHSADEPVPSLDAWEYGDSVLLERYIPGREIQVAVVGGKAIGSVEIRPKDGFYDYTAKYTDGKAEHLVPAPIHPKAHEETLRLAERVHEVLECKGISRSDFRYDDTQGEPGTLYFLELNPQPGMTPLSLVPEIAAASGTSYAQLVQWMIEDASCSR